MLSSYDSMTQGPSKVILNLTFDLDLEKFAQGQSFREKSNFVKLYRVVHQIEGLDPQILLMQYFCPSDVIRRNSDVTKYV